MDEETYMMPRDNGIRDIHGISSRYKQQRMAFRDDTSAYNYHAWLIYARWQVGRGRKMQTILKQLHAMKRILNMYPTKNLANITEEQIIEINAKIITSEYAETTKIDTQIFFRGFLVLHSNTEKRKKTIKNIIKIPERQHHELDQLITEDIFWKLHNSMPREDMKMMIKVLFATGMRVTELYNIKPANIHFIPKSNIINLPKLIGFRGAWIYTKGKRTSWKKEGNYNYFMTRFVMDLYKYIQDKNPEVYLFNISYAWFKKKLYEAAKKNNLQIHPHPHLFRHTVATEYFNNLSNQQVNRIMNWSPNSKMPKIYANLSDRDIVEAVEYYNLRKKAKL